MRTVGQSRGLVHRRYKPQSKRWMYQGKHKKKLSFDAFWFYFEVYAATFAMVLALLTLWLNFC